MKLETRPIHAIKPYEKNPRIIPEKAIKAVARSIERFGWQQPIVIDTEGVIIAGHTRYKAAKFLNLETVPVAIADELTPEQVRAYRIADNKTGEAAKWNLDLLPEEIAPIEDLFDFTQLGFDKDELDKIMGKSIYSREGADPDQVPELPPQAITQPGDVIVMGEHRLVCGDSTKPETYAKLMGDEKADLIVTDPPYGINYEGGKKSPREKIENDARTGDDLIDFLTAALKCGGGASKAGAPVYIWHASNTAWEFMSAARRAGIETRQTLIWIKSAPTLGWSDYLWQHEPCLYYKVPGGPTYWCGDRDQKTLFQDDMKDPKKMTEKELRAEVTKYRRLLQSDVIREKTPNKSPLHPTTKPTRLYTRAIQNSSKRGDLVLDMFCGSGTAVIAAEETHRRARVIELDPKYCDVIVQRWEDYTGLTAERPKH